MTMLVELGIIEWGQVRPFIKQFRRLNVSGTGRLGLGDLHLANLVQDPEHESLSTHLGQRHDRKGAINAAKLKQTLAKRVKRNRRRSI